MIRNTLQAAAVIVAALVLASCQEGVRISLVDAGARSPTFRLESMSSVSEPGEQITQFSVTPLAGPAEGDEVTWQIVSDGDLPVRVREISFGVVPVGFREIAPAKPLRAGKKYVALAAMPGKIGTLEFVAN